MKQSKLSILIRGLIKENPVLVLVLGTCPTLAISTSVSAAIGMGLAATAVLICSNMAISALRKVIPDQVRIPCYIVLIATLVTLLRMVLEKFLPDIYSALGGFLALIVVNCIILGRAEAFANKHTVPEAAMDGLANGIGFTLALTCMGIVCEILGSGSLFGAKLWDFSIALFSQPAGSFIIFGLSIALFTKVMDSVTGNARRKRQAEEARRLFEVRRGNAAKEA